MPLQPKCKRRSPFAPPDRNFWRIVGRPALDERPPLPAGHPVAWGVLTEHTVLEGTPYPFPVFDICS